MFNENLTRKDLDFLDMLRNNLRYPEDYLYYGQMVEELVGDLSEPEEFLKYLKRIKELYGKDENNVR